MIKNKCKICRRLGRKLFLKGERCFSQKCAMIRRAYPPGLPGKRKSGPPSDYKRSLIEKQALKNWYGLSERQFKKYVKDILTKAGKVKNMAEELIKKLEKRLDNVVFRLGLAKSRRQARQLVSHGFFRINNRSVNKPSYGVKKGDVIVFKETKKQKGVLKDLKDTLNKQEIPQWLLFDRNKLEAKVVGEPSLEEARPPADISLIFEFYSK